MCPRWRSPPPRSRPRPPLPTTLRLQGPAYADATGWGGSLFSPDGRSYILQKGGGLHLYEAATRRPRLTLPTPTRVGSTTYTNLHTFVGKGGYVAACRNDRLRVWDLSGTVAFDHVTPSGEYFNCIAASPTADLFAAGETGGRLSLWDAAARKPVGTLAKSGVTVEVAAFSPDGAILATTGTYYGPGGRPNGTDDCEVRLWDVKTRRLLRVFGLERPARSLCFTSDGAMLAAGGYDGDDHVVRFWDIGTGHLRFRWGGHGGHIWGLTRCRGGEVMAAAVTKHEDFIPRGRVRFLELATRTECGVLDDACTLLWSLDAHSGAQDVVAVSGMRDGRTEFFRILGRPPAPPRLPPRLAAGPGPEPSARAQSLWARLASDDAADAYAAVRELAGRPAEAVALFRRRLDPETPRDEAVIGRMIRDLDADVQATRERTAAGLARVVDTAEDELRAALAATTSAESRRRLRRLVDATFAPITDREVLRKIRAIEVLEMIGTPEAVALLEWLASGEPRARLTREAVASLERLKPGKVNPK